MEPINEEDRQRREYSRVEAYLPMEYRIVDPEERDYIQARISGDKPAVEFRPIPDLGGYDPILEEWLKMLNMKMDTIIGLITLQREGYFGLPCKAVNISGGGMSFGVSQAVPMGSTLEIKIVLTAHQTIALCVYGEVVKLEPTNGQYSVAVRYVRMDELVRNEIIRFVFEREREIIREKRG
jgi:c-di-GMP-binding flagellar brake protein YcgR